MNIVIKSINFKASLLLENFIREKVSKLFKQCNTVKRIEVVLREEEYHKIENQSCEIKLDMPGKDPVVKKCTDLFEKSVLVSVKTLQKILRRNKGRLVAGNRHR
jgi:ribosome-associated translation inhibitor RaiA